LACGNKFVYNLSKQFHMPNRTEMTILGIDPGTRNMGYALITLENGKIALLEAGLIKNESRRFTVSDSSNGRGIRDDF